MFGCSRRLLHTCVRQAAMNLHSLIGHLEAIAPSARAESWDNVGLLVEPSGTPSISCVLLTIDLTEQVLREAKRLGAGLIVAYHPPIFQPLKRLTQRSSKERVIVQALEYGMAVYSPHTALDSVEGGVNDWLLAGLGPGKMQALRIHSLTTCPDQKLCLYGLEENIISSIEAVTSRPLMISPSSSSKLYDVEYVCTEEEVKQLLLHLHSTGIPLSSISLQPRPTIPVSGGGRLLTLEKPAHFTDLVTCVKKHLHLQHVRVAQPESWPEDYSVSTVAACAGSGGTVLKGVQADVYITGEMGHHDVLAAVSCATAVILCEHSNSERGFLSIYRSLIQTRTGPEITVALAKSDCDPLVVI